MKDVREPGEPNRREPIARGESVAAAQTLAPQPEPQPASLTVRLSALMFLQYAIVGAWAPVLGPYLKRTLGLTSQETAWIWTTAALGSMLAPLFWGQIADRWLAAERCISLCAAICGATLWFASYVTDPVALFWVFFLFWMFQVPINSIGSALTFRCLAHPDRQFGPIRMWGTVGWMAGGWVFAFWLMRLADPSVARADAFRWGAFYAWTLALYAFTLPPTPPLPARQLPSEHSTWKRWFDAPLRAMHLFRVPAFAVYCTCVFVIYVSWPFNMQMTSLLIEDLTGQSSWLPAIMTISQVTEVTTLALLPWILKRLGQRRTMTVGIVSWSLALLMLASGLSAVFVIPSLLLHGVFICCFMVAGQVFVNRIAHHDYRASVQGLLVLVNGMGQFAGNFAVSGMRDWTHDAYPTAFRPAALGIVFLTVFFLICFRPPPPVAKEGA